MGAHLEAVIFDVDGVIVDTEQLQSDCFANILSSLGYAQHALTTYGTIQIPGESTEQTWERLNISMDISIDITHLSQLKRAMVLDKLDHVTTPMPGLEQLLGELSGNIRVATASSAKRERDSKILHSLGIAKLFEVNVSADDVTHLKPDPEPYLLVAKKLEISPNSCVAIEDTESGVLSASTSGMKVVAVPNIYTAAMNFDRAELITPDLTHLNLVKLQTLFKANN